MMRFVNQRAEIRLKSQILLLPCLNLNVVKLFWLNLFLIYDFFSPLWHTVQGVHHWDRQKPHYEVDMQKRMELFMFC